MSYISSRTVTFGANTFNPSVDVLWQPTGGGDVRTWADVMTVIDGSSKPVRVWIGPQADGPYLVPPGVYNLNSAHFEAAQFGFGAILELQDGAVFDNLGGLFSVSLRGSPTTAPCLTFSQSTGLGGGQIPVALYGGGYENLGTVPLIGVGNGTFVPFIYQSTGLAPSSTAPLFQTGPGSFNALFIDFANQSIGLPNNMVIGDPTSFLIVVHDGSIPSFPLFAAFAGTVINNPVGVDGGSGPTANRPTAGFSAIAIGCCYFDVTLGIPVWWTGVGWVDATGAPA
jgi:hypothetical protein